MMEILPLKMLEKSKKMIKKIYEKNPDKVKDWGFIRSRIERELGKFLFNETGRKPLILVSSISVQS